MTTLINRMWHKVWSSPLHIASPARCLAKQAIVAVGPAPHSAAVPAMDLGVIRCIRIPEKETGPPLPGGRWEYHVALRICFWQDLRFVSETNAPNLRSCGH